MDGPATRTNISAARAALVGRAAERAAIVGLFDDGTHLVTIVGPGGVGKTRLATRLALDHAPAYSAHGGGGAWLVDLTEARSAMAMCAAVAAVLDITLDRDTSEPRVVAALGRALARLRRLLLVLDNCEHIAPHAASTIAAWLAAAPRIDVLATSRVPLGAPGEQLWPLGGLDVPAAEQPVGEARTTDAVELFLRRALQVRPGLRTVDSELAAIGEIVRRLDGMPLAIELAAGRLVALSPSQIRDRLALELLVRPGDTGRHGSMREVIASSVRALAPAERASFGRCATFRGGFTMGAMRDQVLIESARGAAHALGGERAEAEEAFVRAAAASTSCQSEPALLGRSRSIGSSSRARPRRSPMPIASWPRRQATIRASPRACSRHRCEARRARPPCTCRPMARRFARPVRSPRWIWRAVSRCAGSWPRSPTSGSPRPANRSASTSSTLRKLGLRGALVSGDHGYLLDPSVPIVIA